MKISIRVKYAREFAELAEGFKEYASQRLYFQREDDETEVDISFLTLEELETLHKFLLKKYEGSDKPKEGSKDGRDHSVNGALQILSAYKKIKVDPDAAKPTNLRDLAPALKAYIDKNSKSKFLFKVVDGDIKLPYLVVNIDYEPSKPMSGGGVSPAHTDIDLKYIYMDEIKTTCINYYDEALRATDAEGNKTKKSVNLTVAQLLEAKGYIIGTDELMDYYHKELEIFFKYRDQVGEQFTSTGYGRSMEDRWDDKLAALNTDGVPHKLVVDEPLKRKTKADDHFVGSGFWDKDRDKIIRVPVHPFIRVFNLKTHINYSVHTSKLVPYKYQPELIDKLILEEEVKELIELLGRGVGQEFGDIIAGKAEGIIIGCVGEPGLGKSLTAEIYSEFLSRPLYTVQCSQLGTDPDTLEKRLNTVLERAFKWRAVLLLDEADVYIRARGTDILQNAIVGVFLRVLEYYRGIIFATSNVLNLDDAIESRFSAKIVYQYPIADMAKRIWADQLANNKWKSDPELIDIMVSKNLDEEGRSTLSGRDIRNLILLASRKCRKNGTEMTIEALEHASKFTVHGRKKIAQIQNGKDNKENGK